MRENKKYWIAIFVIKNSPTKNLIEDKSLTLL